MKEDGKVLPEGTRVRVTARSVSGDEGSDKSAASPGEYTVYSYVPSGDRDNDDPEKRPYVMLDVSGSYGGVYWAYPEHVEVTQTVAQLAAREIPSLKDVSRTVASGLHSAFGSDGMEFFETSVDGKDDAPYVTASGRTDS